MGRFFSFIVRHAKAVIVLILLCTIFFLFNAINIHLNASFSAFLPWGERSKTYIGGISGQVPDLGISEKATAEAIQKAEKLLETSTHKDVNLVYSSMESTIAPDSIEKVKADDSNDLKYNASYLVFIGGNKLYTADALNLIDACFSHLSSKNDIASPTSVLDYFTLSEKNGRIVFNLINPNNDETWTEEEAKELERRIYRDPIVNNYLTSGDNQGFLYTFRVHDGGAKMFEEFETLLTPLEEYGLSVYINGGPAINVIIMQYLVRDLTLLMSLCIIAILITFYLSFRSKRSVLIPGSLSIIALIWTIGTMSLLSIDLTILNIVTPCMVITLGSAYSIHVISEYYANFSLGERDVKKIITSSSKIIKTIFLACITTIAGFLCLCISETDGLKDFGISVSIGIGYCAILSCSYLPAVLSLTPIPREKQLKIYKEGLMTKFVNAISYLIVKYWKLLIILFIILAFSFFLVKDDISVNSNYMSYFPESDEFGQGSKAFALAMGGTNPYEITITAPEGSERFFLDIDNLKKVRAYEESLLSSPDILQSISITNYISFANELSTGEYRIPDDSGLVNMLSRLIMIMMNQGNTDISRIVSKDFNSITLVIQHWDSIEQDLMTTSSIIRTYNLIVSNLGMLPEGTSVNVVGDPLVNAKFANRLLQDQNRSTILSIIIVLLISSLTFLSLEKGILTIIPVISGIMINYVFMYFSKIPFDIVTVSFSSIAIGCGVDDAIHFMLRLKNKLKNSSDFSKSIEETLRETGRPIILTTVSIVFGMMMLSFASYTPIRYFGLLMSITLFGCMASTLIFLPSFALLFHKIYLTVKRLFSR